jgi:hypothetical protein
MSTKMGRKPKDKSGSFLSDMVVVRVTPETSQAAETLQAREGVGTTSDIYRKAIEIGLKHIAAGVADINDKA